MNTQTKSKMVSLVAGFVDQMTSLIESTAKDERARLLSLISDEAQGPKVVRNRPGKKGKRVAARKAAPWPCAINECGGTARPRDGMVCEAHASLPKEEKKAARDRAKLVGGRWFNLPARNLRSKRAKTRIAKAKKASAS